MLVLTRFRNQSIVIGDPMSPNDLIEVEIVEIRGDQIRLGIKAPRHVAVHRKEVWLQIHGENLDSRAESGKFWIVLKTL